MDLNSEDLILTCITQFFRNLISALLLAENDGSNMHIQPNLYDANFLLTGLHNARMTARNNKIVGR